jgi:hypothetical protein
MKHAPDTSRTVWLISVPPNARNEGFPNSMCLSLTDSNTVTEIFTCFQYCWENMRRPLDSCIGHAAGAVNRTNYKFLTQGMAV